MSFSGQIYTPPPTSGWSWYNQSSGIVNTVNKNAINLYVAKHGSAGADSVSGYYRTAPSTPYTIIANITYNAVDINAATGLIVTPGLGFTDGTGTFFINGRLLDTGYGQCITFFSDSATGVSNDFNNQPATATPYPWSTTQWYMIRDDGTNISFYASSDEQKNGSTWVRMLSQARTNHITPSKVGVFFEGQGHADINVTINSWQALSV